jgi:hypothetical protein
MEFSVNKKYYIIENHPQKGKNAIALGSFINYIDVIWGSDWLPKGKAQFEYGTISMAQYINVVEFEEDQDQDQDQDQDKYV